MPPGSTGRDGPVFNEPWEAEAFAMVAALHDKGIFSWSEWTAALSAKVSAADAERTGSDYYRHWLAALETLLAGKQIVTRTDVDRTAAAWQRAAHATPHGMPILLENDPG